MNDHTRRKPAQALDAFIVAKNSQVDFVAAMFLAIIALLLLFALLRAQKRNRDLLREIMAMQAAVLSETGETG